MSLKTYTKAGILGAFGIAALSSGQYQASAINVAIISGVGSDASSVELAAQLNDDTHFDFSASIVTPDMADSLAELSSYDVIVLGDSGFNDNGYTQQMYAAAKAYLNSGGGIVTTGWYNFATGYLSGTSAADADYITPIATVGFEYQGRPATVSILDASHPITAGIADYSITSNYIEASSYLDPGAVGLASAGGKYTTVYQDLNGRSVYLGGQYMANQSHYNTPGLRSGVEDQLLEQAVAWAAVPEPSSLALLGLGGLLVARRRRTA